MLSYLPPSWFTAQLIHKCYNLFSIFFAVLGYFLEITCMVALAAVIQKEFILLCSSNRHLPVGERLVPFQFVVWQLVRLCWIFLFFAIVVMQLPFNVVFDSHPRYEVLCVRTFVMQFLLLCSEIESCGMNCTKLLRRTLLTRLKQCIWTLLFLLKSRFRVLFSVGSGMKKEVMNK